MDDVELILTHEVDDMNRNLPYTVYNILYIIYFPGNLFLIYSGETENHVLILTALQTINIK